MKPLFCINNTIDYIKQLNFLANCKSIRCDRINITQTDNKIRLSYFDEQIGITY